MILKGFYLIKKSRLLFKPRPWITNNSSKTQFMFYLLFESTEISCMFTLRRRSNFIYGPECGEVLHLLLFKITSKLVCTLLMTSMALATGPIYMCSCAVLMHLNTGPCSFLSSLAYMLIHACVAIWIYIR